jgi:glucoamylase
MELFANDGLLISEQVWDGVGDTNPHSYQPGDGTDSATPLAWSHAEYIKLLRSLSRPPVWDRYAPVAARYAK